MLMLHLYFVYDLWRIEIARAWRCIFQRFFPSNFKTCFADLLPRFSLSLSLHAKCKHACSDLVRVFVCVCGQCLVFTVYASSDISDWNSFVLACLWNAFNLNSERRFFAKVKIKLLHFSSLHSRFSFLVSNIATIKRTDAVQIAFHIIAYHAMAGAVDFCSCSLFLFRVHQFSNEENPNNNSRWRRMMRFTSKFFRAMNV